MQVPLCCVFGYISMIGVFCILLGIVVIFFLRMILALISGCLSEYYIVRICVHLCCILHIVVGILALFARKECFVLLYVDVHECYCYYTFV